MKQERYIGRPLESLTVAERWKLAGRWVALEVYTPETLPLRTIEAIGDSASDCIAQLTERGRNAAHYEFQPLAQPYAP